MRIEKLADDLYDCNYIMFQNTAYGTKWFYAFILEVNYINDKTTEIIYELDVMQTWYFDYEPQSCYIEREHTATDEIGDNIIDENIPVSIYEYSLIEHPSIFDRTNAKILVFSSDIPISMFWTHSEPKMISGVFNGLYMIAFDPADVGTDTPYTDAEHTGDILKFIDEMTNSNKIDAVVSIVMIPKDMLGFTSSAGWLPIQDITGYPISINKQQSTLGNYTPRNKKLFTYPFNQLYVFDGNGSGHDFPMELFNSTGADANKCIFNLRIFLAPGAEMALIPTDYKGITGLNNNERMIVSNFPVCSFNVDSYKAWLAQNRYSSISKLANLGIGTAQNVVGAFGQAANGKAAEGASNLIGTGFSILKGITSSILSMYQASTLPNQARGQLSNGIDMTENCFGFTFYQAYPHPQISAIIDDYFDRFGYACKRNKVPGVSNVSLTRPNWGYVKTIGCTITGSIPADDQRKIVNIYNSGITFWADGDNVGDYTLNNAPVTPTP